MSNITKEQLTRFIDEISKSIVIKEEPTIINRGYGLYEINSGGIKTLCGIGFAKKYCELTGQKLPI